MIYRVMLPLLLIVFVLMGLWVSFLHFPCNWVMYVVMGLEVLLATVVMAMEYQAQHVGGASGWRKWLGQLWFSWPQCLFGLFTGHRPYANLDLPKILSLAI